MNFLRKEDGSIRVSTDVYESWEGIFVLKETGDMEDSILISTLRSSRGKRSGHNSTSPLLQLNIHP